LKRIRLTNMIAINLDYNGKSDELRMAIRFPIVNS